MGKLTPSMFYHGDGTPKAKVKIKESTPKERDEFLEPMKGIIKKNTVLSKKKGW